MTRDSITNDIAQAVPRLLAMARDLAWNPIAEDCLFLLTEGPCPRALAKPKKATPPPHTPLPVPLHALAPALGQGYAQWHDINLFIYQATRECTIVEVRCFPRAALAEAYRQQVCARPPMLHCKVAVPPWLALAQPPVRFDINWERKPGWARWKMFWFRCRTRFGRGSKR